MEHRAHPTVLMAGPPATAGAGAMVRGGDEQVRSAVAMCIGAVTATAVVYWLLLGDRSDYLGHYLAGFAGTLFLLATVGWRRRPLEAVVVAVALISIGIGAAVEMAEVVVLEWAPFFDPVDFFNQSLGAGLAAGVVVGRPGNPRLAATLSAVGLVTMALGCAFAFG